MSYRHGVFVSEQATGVLPPVRTSASLPVVVGTAPVHMIAEGFTGKINEPVLCYTKAEAIAAFGNSPEWDKYTLCEFIDSYFNLFNVAPVVLVNVYDPADVAGQVTAAAEPHTFDATDVIQLANVGLISAPTVTGASGSPSYVRDTDYTVDLIKGEVIRIDGGSIVANGEIEVTYTYGDPSNIVSADIIGTVDGTTGAKSGLELVNEIFPRFRLVPGQIVANGWSHDPAVAAVMSAKAGSINQHFSAIALIDIQDDTVQNYTDVPGWKNDNNLTADNIAVCWPKVKLGDKEYWMSTQLAGLMARTDSEHEGIPFKSPSNENFQMDSAVNNGAEVYLGPDQASYLNGQGIITTLNFSGGWKCWGNRTGAYPAVTDIKDAFLPVRRMFNWIGNTLTLTWWQKVDYPTTRRLIETIVDSANIWLNGLAAREFILGGRVEFQPDENPTTDLLDGIIKFHVYVTPPAPAKEIMFVLEYDPEYMQTLFG